MKMINLVKKYVNLLKPITFKRRFSWMTHDLITRKMLDDNHPDCVYRKIRTFDDATRVYNEMCKMRPLPPIVKFNRLLSLVSKLKTNEDAIYMFKHMIKLVRVVPDVFTTNIVIGFYCKISRTTDGGYSLLALAIKKGGVMLDKFTFTTLLNGLINEGKHVEAGALYQKVIKKEKGCEPDVVMLNTVLKGLTRFGLYDDAFTLLKVKEEETGCKADLITYNTLIDGLCRAARIDEALHLAQRMGRVDIVTFNMILHCLCLFCHWEEVRSILRIMEENVIHSDTKTYTIIVTALNKELQVLQASSALGIIFKRGLELDTIMCSSLIQGLCLIPDMRGAENLFISLNGMEGMVPDIATFNSMIHGYFLELNTTYSMKMFGAVLADRNLNPNSITYNILIQGFFHVSQPTLAYGLFLKNPNPSLATFEIVLEGLSINYHLPQAMGFLRWLEKQQGGVRNVRYYRILLDGFAQSSLIDFAKILFGQTIVMGMQPDIILNNVMIHGFCWDEKAEEALDWFQRMEKAGCPRDVITYNMLLQGLYMNKHFDREVYDLLLTDMFHRGIGIEDGTYKMIHWLFPENHVVSKLKHAKDRQKLRFVRPLPEESLLEGGGV